MDGGFHHGAQDVRTKLALLADATSGASSKRSNLLERHVDGCVVVPAVGFELRKKRSDRDVDILDAYERGINHAVARPRFHDKCTFCGGGENERVFKMRARSHAAPTFQLPAASSPPGRPRPSTATSSATTLLSRGGGGSAPIGEIDSSKFTFRH